MKKFYANDDLEKVQPFFCLGPILTLTAYRRNNRTICPAVCMVYVRIADPADPPPPATDRPRLDVPALVAQTKIAKINSVRFRLA
jgi:hypothetical protein